MSRSRDPMRLWRPTGAPPDEPLRPDCEGALVDEQGRIIAAVYPDDEPTCDECGLPRRLHRT